MWGNITEGTSTFSAFIRFHSYANSTVSQVWNLATDESTLTVFQDSRNTLMFNEFSELSWSVPWMSSLVSNECRFSAKDYVPWPLCSWCVWTRLDKWEKGYTQLLNPQSLSFMSYSMYSGGWIRAEGLLTLIAYKRFVSCVYFLVGDETKILWIGSSTLSTYKGSLPRVKSLMLDKAYFLPIGVATFIALLRFVSTMSSLMYNEIPLWGETFSTFTAYKRFLSRMGSLMNNKTAFHSEAFPTFITCIRFLSSMNLLV